MIYTEGNIWDYQDKAYLVIPTNIGWKSTGEAVMGQGLILEARKKFPALSRLYGEYCRSKYHTLRNKHPGIYVYESSLLLFPVRGLNVIQPYLSWRNMPDIETLEESCRGLLMLAHSRLLKDKEIVMPQLGAGAAGLPWNEVQPVLEHWFKEERYVCVSKSRP